MRKHDRQVRQIVSRNVVRRHADALTGVLNWSSKHDLVPVYIICIPVICCEKVTPGITPMYKET